MGRENRVKAGRYIQDILKTRHRLLNRDFSFKRGFRELKSGGLGVELLKPCDCLPQMRQNLSTFL